MKQPQTVVIVGGGFTGLAAGFHLAQRGENVTILEREKDVGGLASSYDVGGRKLEKFYHHWFTSDTDIFNLIAEIGCKNKIKFRAVKSGVYYSNSFFKLSSPIELLKFKALPFGSRLRLGLLILWVRTVKNWSRLESMSARDWLRRVGGERAYKVVWEPLLRGKFGELAEEVSAVWIWNKLKLRGGSRSNNGQETLAYYDGGFAALADDLSNAIEKLGGKICRHTTALSLEVAHQKVTGIYTTAGYIETESVIITTPLPDAASIMKEEVLDEYKRGLLGVTYLANLCIVLELSQSLSDLYWIIVNDVNFPFVGIIEHTNFEDKDQYAGRHIVYLSKYLPPSDPLYTLDDESLLRFAVHNLKNMFPHFKESSIVRTSAWRARYAQPVVVRNYSKLIPSYKTPINGVFLATMAQIYPEDRGTNYAIREGRKIADMVLDDGQF
jgi:protoporphyrinogen oxidase